MVLGFKEQFVEKILSGVKIHTIRIDQHSRWKEGNTIQFATGVRTKNYKKFKDGTCFSTQYIYINPIVKSIHIKSTRHKLSLSDKLGVDTISLNKRGIKMLAKADGFESVDKFWEWFNEPFKGKIVHWTDFLY